MQPANSHFVYVWEFEIVPETLATFLAFYGPAGEWSKLFARADGYVGTLLLNDRLRPNRYLTLDRWANDQAFETFLARFRAEYEKIDQACEALTTRETSLGSYWVHDDQPPV